MNKVYLITERVYDVTSTSSHTNLLWAVTDEAVANELLALCWKTYDENVEYFNSVPGSFRHLSWSSFHLQVVDTTTFNNSVEINQAVRNNFSWPQQSKQKTKGKK